MNAQAKAWAYDFSTTKAWAYDFSALRPLGALLDARQLMTPIALELTGPFVERPNRLDVRPIEDLPAVAPHVHEPDVPQHTQVFRNAWLSDGQRLDDVADRTL